MRDGTPAQRASILSYRQRKQLCAMAFAASQNAVVYGTVYDASAKPLAGVQVLLENPANGFPSRTTTTTSDGTYTFSEVPPASGYKVTALQDGKTIDIRGGITVNVGEESVIFPALKGSRARAVRRWLCPSTCRTRPRPRKWP